MIERALRKAQRVNWMLRYWVMDKYHEQLRQVAVGIALLIVMLVLFWMYSGYIDRQLHGVAPADRVVKAFVWWIYLIVVLVAAVVAYAMMPKPQTPQPQKAQTPVTKDGKSMRRIYGTVWTTDPAMLAWKNGAPEPIRKKGGKK